MKRWHYLNAFIVLKLSTSFRDALVREEKVLHRRVSEYDNN